MGTDVTGGDFFDVIRALLRDTRTRKDDELKQLEIGEADAK